MTRRAGVHKGTPAFVYTRQFPTARERTTPAFAEKTEYHE